MKRLPFALIALSLSIPAVACLNGAAEEDAVSGEDELSQETKAACNFAFKEVPNAVKKAKTDAAGVQLKMTSSFGITAGQRLVWGDFNGDGTKDFAFSPGNREIQVYLGDKDAPGNFVRSKTSAKFPEIADQTRSALALVSTGDFDGDGKSDIVAIATVKNTGPNAPVDAAPTGVVAVFYGAAGADASLEAPKTLPTLAGAIESETHYHEAGDLDGDGKDDLVLTADKSEIVAFGAADRTLTAAPSGFDSARVRSLAFISPKTADKAAQLIIATPKEIATITYDAAHKATVSTQPYEFAAGTSRWIGTKLDAKSANNGDIAILGNSGLSVVPVTATQAKKANLWEGVPGEMIGALDLDGNEQQELLFKVDDSKLFAACGTNKAAKEIAAAPLDIAYGKNLIVAGRLDLNGDKKADLVTLDISPEGEASRGTVKVYLSNGKADPAPELQIFAAPGGASAVDAGPPAVDATVPKDSSAPVTDGSVVPPADAGVKVDSGTTAPVDAGAPKVDSGAPKVDAGTGPGPKKDAGTAAPEDGDDDDDDSETTPPDDEGTGTKNDKPKKPAKPSTNGATTGNSNVSIIPKPVATDDGCSTTGAPGSGGLSTSAFGGLAAAMMLLARRRRNKKA